MTMGQTEKPRGPAPTDRVCIMVAPMDTETLRDLQQEASDHLGRAISASAVMRALLRLTRRRKVTRDLIALVSAEVDAGHQHGAHPGERRGYPKKAA